MKTFTHEGGDGFLDPGNKLVAFFEKAGSAFEGRRRTETFYDDPTSALDLFKAAWAAGNKFICMKLLFWLRNCRGGAGNRQASRSIYAWLAKEDPTWLKVNLELISKYGRWDDYRILLEASDVSKEIRDLAASIWSEALKRRDFLAAKWADRSDKQLRYCLGLSESQFRRLLASIRAADIPEAKMCSGEWDRINYPAVPSLCMVRNTNAFERHDEHRFAAYKRALKEGTAKINAKVLFPHDVVRLALHTEASNAEIVNAQFRTLPDYIPEKSRIMVVCDTSGSMESPVSGKVSALHVSVGLALYCSDRLGEGNPFYRKFIGFASEASFKDWSKMTPFEALHDDNIIDGAVGSTNICQALNTLLNAGKMFSASRDVMPTTLLIVSDMQFTDNHVGRRVGISACLDKWEAAGFIRPTVVYWNISPYDRSSPAQSTTKDAALISGFSPSILLSVLAGEEITPLSVMLKTIEPYTDVKRP